MAKAGNFELTVSEPYPVWITLKNQWQEWRFDHKELSDLLYVVKRGVAEAKAKLGPDAKEEIIT